MNIAFETLSGSAERPNEDWVAATPHAVVVLDGVTAPRVDDSGCHHSVTWYAENLGSRLLVRLLSDGVTVQRALAEAIGDVTDLHRDTCTVTGAGVPAAAVAILRRRGEVFDYLVLADAAVVIDADGDVITICDTRVENAAPEALARTREDPIGSPEHRAKVAEMSVEQLKRRNVAGGYWVAAADREAADNAYVGEIPVEKVRRVAIFTDGASRAVDTFHEMDWPTCLDYLQEHGPRGLIQRVRQIEEDDPEGRKWPRFKKSDDATVAIVDM